MAGQAGADPISAIANALGSLYDGISNVWGSIVQKKIAKEQTKTAAQLTIAEKIKYNELISAGNYNAASELLAVKQSKTDAANTIIYIVLGLTFLTVMVIIYTKAKRK